MLAAFLIVTTLALPGASDQRYVVESWVGPTLEDFVTCADLASQQNELFAYLREQGISGGNRRAVCEVGEADERVADINRTRFNRAMTTPQMVPVKF